MQVNTGTSTPTPQAPPVAAASPIRYDEVTRIITVHNRQFKVKTLKVEGRVVDLTKLDNGSFAKIVDEFALEFLAKIPTNELQKKHVTVGVENNNTANLFNERGARVRDMGHLTAPEEEKVQEIKRRAHTIFTGTEAVEKVERKFSREISSTIAKVAEDVGTVAAVALVAPFLALGGGVVATGYGVKKLFDRVRGSHGHVLRTAVDTMKKKEERTKFELLSGLARNNRIGADVEPGWNEVVTTINDQTAFRTQVAEAFSGQTIKNKLLERLVVCAARSGNYDSPNLGQSGIARTIGDKTSDFKARWEQQLQTITANHFADVSSLRAFIKTIDPDFSSSIADQDLKEVVAESKLLLANTQEDFEATEEIVEKDLVKFDSLLEELRVVPTANFDYGAANLRVTKKFREFLRSPTYQALKEDPNNKLIQFVHRFAVAIYNDVKVMDAYIEYGQALMTLPREAAAVGPLPEEDNVAAPVPVVEVEQAPEPAITGIEIEFEQVGDVGNVDQSAPKEPLVLTSPEERRTFREELQDQHAIGKKYLHTDHGIGEKLLYAFSHPKQALGAFKSLGAMQGYLSGALGLNEYDPHGALSNNPSLQGTTTLKVTKNGQEIDLRINNCYGASPTIGDQISPEFLAVLQAIENNNNPKCQNSNPNIPSALTYTNFQDIDDKGGEGQRSFALMHLATRYPNAIVAATLGKDSDFYQMKGAAATATWEGVQQFGQEFQALLTGDDCYSYLERATGHGNGIYLPGGKQAWAAVIPEIITTANQYFETLNDLQDEANNFNVRNTQPEIVASRRGAYQEYVYSMIQAYMEKKAGVDQLEKTGNTQPLIMSIGACKENIDRGGISNFKQVYVRIGSNSINVDKKPLLAALVDVRALSSRDRVALDHRFENVFAFVDHVDPESFADDEAHLMEGLLGVDYNELPDYQLGLTAQTVRRDVILSDEELSDVSTQTLQHDTIRIDDLEDDIDLLSLEEDLGASTPSGRTASSVEQLPADGTIRIHNESDSDSDGPFGRMGSNSDSEDE